MSRKRLDRSSWPRALRRNLFEGEDVVVITRLHLSRLWPTVAFVLLVCAAVAVLWRLNGGLFEVPVPPLGAVAGFLVLLLVWRILQWRARRFIVTTHRLIHLSGVVSSRVSSAPLVSVMDLGYRQSLMGKLFRYGDVTVIASDWRQRIGPLPRPQRILEAIAAACSWSSPADVPAEERVFRPAHETWKLHEGVAADDEVESPPAEGAGHSLHRPLPTGAPAGGEGSTIAGRYLLARKLATGGMGTVYEGVDERLGRPVAIKVLKEELTQDSRFVERFGREARSAALLGHPNITSIFDYGEDEGLPYIVMELVRGSDLGVELQRESPFGVTRAVQLTCQVLDALQHAHEAGLIHRDVKPANVIVTDRDRIKVTDFGIARAAGASRLTATGIILGSAHYVSPEHVRGEPAVPQSDIYSVGILMYEMLTGRTPFEGESLLQVAERHLMEEVPPPSLISAEIPRALDQVVTRATAKAAGDRFRSAEDMASALAPWRHEGREGDRGDVSMGVTRRLPRRDEIDTPELRHLSS
jgi:hypothetical protein